MNKLRILNASELVGVYGGVIPLCVGGGILISAAGLTFMTVGVWFCLHPLQLIVPATSLGLSASIAAERAGQTRVVSTRPCQIMAGSAIFTSLILMPAGATMMWYGSIHNVTSKIGL